MVAASDAPSAIVVTPAVSGSRLPPADCRRHRVILSRQELASLVDGTGWAIARLIGEGAHCIAVLEKTP